jgi:hypothetical protein
MKRINPFRPIRVDFQRWQQWERVALDAEMLTRDPLHAARAFMCVDGVRICSLVEANVTVADLEKSKTSPSCRRGGGLKEAEGLWHAAAQPPEHAGPGPKHTF